MWLFGISFVRVSCVPVWFVCVALGLVALGLVALVLVALGLVALVRVSFVHVLLVRVLLWQACFVNGEQGAMGPMRRLAVQAMRSHPTCDIHHRHSLSRSH